MPVSTWPAVTCMRRSDRGAARARRRRSGATARSPTRTRCRRSTARPGRARRRRMRRGASCWTTSRGRAPCARCRARAGRCCGMLAGAPGRGRACSVHLDHRRPRRRAHVESGLLPVRMCHCMRQQALLQHARRTRSLTAGVRFKAVQKMLAKLLVWGHALRLRRGGVRGAQARARRAEAATKLAELQRDISQLEQLSGDQVAAEDAATQQLLEVRV